MFDYAAVAVEIWHQILCAVIDLPYVLDTLVDRDTDHWRNSFKYHDLTIYKASEEERRTLRLVCRSWQEFADGWKYRWINYNTKGLGNEGEQRETREALGAMNSFAGLENGGIAIRPRRILFHVNTDEDLELFRRTIDWGSSRVTTFFVKCEDTKGYMYADQILEYMTTNSSKLSMLRCLAIPAPNPNSNPLRALSKAFPNLITLTINSQRSYRLRDDDQMLLPDLEILGLDIAALPATTFRKWDYQGMIHLATPLGRSPPEGCSRVVLEPIHSLGANLTFLNIYRIHQAVCLPPEFWTWCPCLVEFLAFFSWVYPGASAPPDHPLKYVVHWPHYDYSDNPLIGGGGSPNVTNPVVLHSLQMFPRGLKVFAVWRTWRKYLELLATRDRYDLREREDILRQMAKICKERQVRVEDEDQVSLEEFLVSAGIPMVENDEFM